MRELLNTEMILPVLIAFAISAVLGPVIIPILRKLKIGDTERAEGPSTHKGKAGTPLMGGIIFLIAIVITSLIYIKDYPKIIPVLFMTLGFGLIGFLDDYIKVVLKRSMGLKAWQKMLAQIAVTAAFIFYMYQYSGIGLTMLIPFGNGSYLDLGIFTIPFMFLVILGTVNGSNLTDGVDGLETSVTIIIATFFSVVAMGMNFGLEPITCAVVGALLGFLLFNVYPAQVFMGDTGSLALGGFVVATAYMLQMPLFLVLVCFIYLMEIISVLLQVSYFKVTHGKRIFRMSPIHHHFELGGWSETKVVAVFSIITTLLCLVAYMAL